MLGEPPLPGKEILETRQCWKLLQGASLGRLAVSVEGHLEIFPVNDRVDDGTIVFRTGEGTKFRAALEGSVALETDGLGADARQAWSVLVTGRAETVRVTDEFLGKVGLLLFPWAAGTKDLFVRIVPTAVTGRRFTIPQQLSWWFELDRTGRQAID